MPTTEVRLTPKQQQVFNHLKAGLKPAEIAKRMKTSPSSVYGHIRKIREAGVTLPNEEAVLSNEATAALSNEAAAQANGNTKLPDEQSEPTEALSLAIFHCDQQLKELGVEQEEIRERLEAISKAQEITGKRRKRFTEALDVLNGAD